MATLSGLCDSQHPTDRQHTISHLLLCQSWAAFLHVDCCGTSPAPPTHSGTAVSPKKILQSQKILNMFSMLNIGDFLKILKIANAMANYDQDEIRLTWVRSRNRL